MSQPKRPEPGGEEGIVLLLVLVLIVVSISTVYAMTKTTMVEALSTRGRQERARAQLLAQSGLSIAYRALQDDMTSEDPLLQAIESSNDAWALLGAQPIAVDEHGGLLSIHVRDSGSRIGINALVDPEKGERVGELSRAFLVAALERIVDQTPELARSRLVNDEVRGDLADALLDWIDRDENTRLGTPEEDYYARADGLPLNRPVFSLDELADVPGVEPLVLAAIKAYFSPYPLFPTQDQGGGVNLNTAPPEVLSLLYTGTEFEMRLVSDDDVRRLLKARENGDVFCAEPSSDCLSFEQELRLGGGQKVFPPLTWQASVFDVSVEARYSQHARACVRQIVDRSHPDGMATLYHRIGC